jgi:hypothetical protein
MKGETHEGNNLEVDETLEIKPSDDSQEPVEGKKLAADEALDGTQEPEQGSLGEGTITLLATYSYEEEPKAKAPTNPQELVRSPSK